MRYVRSRALLAIAACALMATIASPASAAEVLRTSTGFHCSSAVNEDPGGAPEIVELNTADTEACSIRGAAKDFEFSGVFGVMAICDIDLEGMISETGVLLGSWSRGRSCRDTIGTGKVAPCLLLGERHVRANLKSGTGAGPFPSEMNICFAMFSMVFHCDEVAFTFNELAARTYDLAFAHSSLCQNPMASIQGTITQVIDAAHPKIQIE